MEIWPAIDLLGGKCVRLKQGDYAQDTVFSEHPDEVAAKWFRSGAKLLHCVDLDGAKTGSIVNETAIQGIVHSGAGAPIQLGGGVRNETTIVRLLGLGLSRLVVGTSALKDPEWFAAMCDRYPNRLVLGVDARNGMVATEGWLETSSTPATQLIRDIAKRTQACVAVVYTDISRDGMMEGPNFESLAEVQAASPIPVIASGGVTTLDDVRELVKRKTHGAIIGRSLYEGRIDLADVLAIAHH